MRAQRHSTLRAAQQVIVSHRGGIQVANIPPDLARLIARWESLPPHIREAIFTLIDAVPFDRALGNTLGANRSV